MKKISFRLVSSELSPFLSGPDPEEVRIPLSEHIPIVKKADEVFSGTRIAVHTDPQEEDAISSITGVITDLNHACITIKKQEVVRPVSAPPKPAKLEGLAGHALAVELKRLGLGLHEFKAKGGHLIINALNPEPGIYWAEGMFQNHLEEFKAAIELIRRLNQPSRISIALPKGCSLNLGSDVRRYHIRPVYPNSLPQLVAKAIAKSENPKGVSVFSLHSWWRYSQVVKTGLPSLSALINVQGKNYHALIGTPIRSLLEHAGLTPQTGDHVIVGGRMRGKDIANLEQGVTANACAVFRLTREFTTERETPCVNCGACVQYCPAYLMPNIISRHIERGNYEGCAKFQVGACMDCGLCNYYCIARRPMLHYMRKANEYFAATGPGGNAGESHV